MECFNNILNVPHIQCDFIKSMWQIKKASKTCYNKLSGFGKEKARKGEKYKIIQQEDERIGTT